MREDGTRGARHGRPTEGSGNPQPRGRSRFGADTADEDERRARGTHRTRRPGIGAADARARPQAELRRAPQAREEPARDARRAAVADRGGLRGHPGGGHRPAQVVGPLPRQAEGRHVHAPDQAPGRAHRAAPAARRRRALRRARLRRGRAQHAADDPAPLPPARGAAGRLRAPRRRRSDDRGRLRRRRAQRHGLPPRRDGARRALRRDAGDRRGDELLLRQPGLQRPAAEAQDHDLDLRAPLQRRRDQLHRARRDDPRRRRGVRRDGRRWALVRPAPRARPGCLRPEGGDPRGPAGDHRRLAGGSPLPRLAGQGAPEVHDRRHRDGGHARPRRAAPRPQAAGLRAAPAPRGRARPHGRRPPSATGRARSGSRSTSGS